MLVGSEIVEIDGISNPTNGGYKTYVATISGKTYHYSRNTVTPYNDLCQMFKDTPGYDKVVQEFYNVLVANNAYDWEEFQNIVENDSISVLQAVDGHRGPGEWVSFWAAGLKYAYEHKSEFPTEDFKVATTLARDLIRASGYGRTALAQTPDESAGSYLYEESKIPQNFMTDSTGKIYELVSGSNPTEWREWMFGGKNVYIRKANLGEISQ